jgi:hypothetical protein
MFFSGTVMLKHEQEKVFLILHPGPAELKEKVFRFTVAACTIDWRFRI